MKISSMRRFVRGFIAQCSGATGVEYGLLLAGIGLVVAVAVNPIGQAIKSTFETIEAALR